MSKDFKDQQILNLSHFLGYFTHVTTLGEVKEQVLKYIPVMARPMVMYRDKHPIIWTGVYADIEVGISKVKGHMLLGCRMEGPNRYLCDI